MTTYTFTAPNSNATLRGAIEHGRYHAEAIVEAVARCAEEPGRVECVFSATHDRETRTGNVLRALRFGVSEDGSWRIDEGAGIEGPGSHQLARADASAALVCTLVALRVSREGATVFVAA
jgi:hypothetical protein